MHKLGELQLLIFQSLQKNIYITCQTTDISQNNTTGIYRKKIYQTYAYTTSLLII